MHPSPPSTFEEPTRASFNFKEQIYRKLKMMRFYFGLAHTYQTMCLGFYRSHSFRKLFGCPSRSLPAKVLPESWNRVSRMETVYRWRSSSAKLLAQKWLVRELLPSRFMNLSESVIALFLVILGIRRVLWWHLMQQQYCGCHGSSGDALRWSNVSLSRRKCEGRSWFRSRGKNAARVTLRVAHANKHCVGPQMLRAFAAFKVQVPSFYSSCFSRAGNVGNECADMRPPQA